VDFATLALAAGLTGWTPPALPPAAETPLPPRSVAIPQGFVGPLVVASPSAALTTWTDAIAAMATSAVVCVGEKHDEASHHQVQAEALLALDAFPGLSLGLEMVAAEDQPALDAFQSGAMSEADFAVWWSKNWGYPYAIYKPIFDAARSRAIPIHGLNAPAALVKAVAKVGLAGLPAADRARLPASVAESADARYRAYVKESLTGHGPVPDDRLARMTQAMAVWNETMGENAARLTAGGKRVLVVAGQGHCLYGAGVPESARRRGAPSAQVLLPYPLDGEKTPLGEQLAALQDPASAHIAFGDFFRLIAP
jgi:uncharacterized iron-regulated protein